MKIWKSSAKTHMTAEINQIHVNIVGGYRIPGRDMYVKAKLGATALKTPVSLERPNPIWQQKFIFGVGLEQAERAKSSFSTTDSARFSNSAPALDSSELPASPSESPSLLRPSASTPSSSPSLSGSLQSSEMVLRVSVWESNTFSADEWLGGVDVRVDPLVLRKNSTIEQTVPISTKRKSAEGPTSYLTLRLCWSYDSERQAESSESASSTVLDESGKGGKSTSACAISHHKDALQKPGEGQLTADGNSLAGLIGAMSSKVEEDSRLSAKQRSLISRSSSYVNSVGMLASALNGDRVGQEKRKGVVQGLLDREGKITRTRKTLESLPYSLTDISRISQQNLETMTNYLPGMLAAFRMPLYLPTADISLRNSNLAPKVSNDTDDDALYYASPPAAQL